MDTEDGDCRLRPILDECRVGKKCNGFISTAFPSQQSCSALGGGIPEKGYNAECDNTEEKTKENEEPMGKIGTLERVIKKER